MGCRMTLNDLSDQLKALPKGKAAGIHHEVYADLFPPGEPDEGARERCYEFAKALGCRIENEPAHKTVWFVKNA